MLVPVGSDVFVVLVVDVSVLGVIFPVILSPSIAVLVMVLFDGSSELFPTSVSIGMVGMVLFPLSDMEFVVEAIPLLFPLGIVDSSCLVILAVLSVVDFHPVQMSSVVDLVEPLI